MPGDFYFVSTWTDASGQELEGAPTEAGTYGRVYTGTGDYHGSRSVTIEVYDLHDIGSYAANAQVIKGKVCGERVECKPRIILTLAGTTRRLSEGSDYAITWLDDQGCMLEGTPTQAGRYTALVEGIAPYYGSHTFTVEVVDWGDISQEWRVSVVKPACIKDGHFIDPQIYVFGSAGNSPVVGKDYRVVWFDSNGNEMSGEPTTVGTYRVACEGMGDFRGRTDLLQVAVSDYYELPGDSSGQPQRIEATIVDGEIQSITPFIYRDTGEGMVYYPRSSFEIVEWIDASGNAIEGVPTRAGIYRARLEGRGAYHGTIEVSAKVRGSLSNDISDGSIVLNGELYAVDGVLHFEGEPVVLLQDGRRLDKGCWRIARITTTTGEEVTSFLRTPKSFVFEIEGIGEWTGSFTKQLYVGGYDGRSAFDISFDGDGVADEAGVLHFAYTGKPIDPGVVVTRVLPANASSKTYVEGVDYKVEISNPVGTPGKSVRGQIDVLGLGGYTFFKSVSYVIDDVIDIDSVLSSVAITDGLDSYAASAPMHRFFTTGGYRSSGCLVRFGSGSY